MIYSPSTTAALGIVEDAQPEEPLTLRGEGLWVCLISLSLIHISEPTRP